ncbi:MAG TPA: terminase large subunit, partial [Lachnospiraceae bacterium]|nr:terminase large subunit [Lachnospiraceae bacterium]
MSSAPSETLLQYAHDCIAGKIVSGRKHKWACLRFLRDWEAMQKGSFPYHWDEIEAQKIIDWFRLLRHSKGVLAGEPIELIPWQQFHLCQLYGWRKENGRRRFTKSFIEVGRKNAKSQEEAGVALYEMSVTAAKNKEVNEVYTAGVKRDQSKIVFTEAGLMLKGSPLAPKFNVGKVQTTHTRSGSVMRPLSKDDGKSGDGSNPALLIIDEYHQHPTTEFYDLGLGGNTKEPLVMIITTAGRDLTYPCYTQEYAYCSKILDPDVDVHNDQYLIDICELDPEDYADPANVANEDLWLKANPIRATYPEGIQKIREECELAQQMPEKMTSFLTKCMNVWVQAKENGYMDMAKWKACQVDQLPIDTKGRSVYVGFDMSAKVDLTSVAFVIPFISDKVDEDRTPVPQYIVYSHSFIPNREKLAERIAKDKVPYDAWEREGFLTVTDTPIVDQDAVMRYVLQTCEENDWHIENLCFDPANASLLMMQLSNEGYDVVEVFQSHKSLN